MAQKTKPTLSLNEIMNMTDKLARKYHGKKIEVPHVFNFCQEDIPEAERRKKFEEILAKAHKRDMLKEWPVKTTYDNTNFFIAIREILAIKKIGRGASMRFKEVMLELAYYMKSPFDFPGACFIRREQDELVVIKKRGKVHAYSFPLGTLSQ